MIQISEDALIEMIAIIRNELKIDVSNEVILNIVEETLMESLNTIKKLVEIATSKVKD